MPRTIEPEDAMPLLAALAAGVELHGPDVRTATRFALQELAARHPGRSVEVRVPFAGAVQIVAGPTHRRGTPPNVVEISITTFLDLCVGRRRWQDALASGEIAASGTRADLAEFFPLFAPAALDRWRGAPAT